MEIKRVLFVFTLLHIIMVTIIKTKKYGIIFMKCLS